jgi:hypothetical protein
VFGAFNQNWSSLEASLGFAAITDTPRIENGGTVAAYFADGRLTLSSLMRYNLLGSRFDSSGLVSIVHIRNVRRAGNRHTSSRLLRSWV